jgi:MFS transporter, PHS family, inorganic phosphate transporter
MWRLLVGLGCIPAVAALYFRLTIPETPRFTMDIARNVRQARQDINHFLSIGGHFIDPDVTMTIHTPQASRRDFFVYFSKWSNLKILFGTSWSWFALDVRYLPCSPKMVLIEHVTISSPSTASA